VYASHGSWSKPHYSSSPPKRRLRSGRRSTSLRARRRSVPGLVACAEPIPRDGPPSHLWDTDTLNRQPRSWRHASRRPSGAPTDLGHAAARSRRIPVIRGNRIPAKPIPGRLRRRGRTAAVHIWSPSSQNTPTRRHHASLQTTPHVRAPIAQLLVTDPGERVIHPDPGCGYRASLRDREPARSRPRRRTDGPSSDATKQTVGIVTLRLARPRAVAAFNGIRR